MNRLVVWSEVAHAKAELQGTGQTAALPDIGHFHFQAAAGSAGVAIWDLKPSTLILTSGVQGFSHAFTRLCSYSHCKASSLLSGI